MTVASALSTPTGTKESGRRAVRTCLRAGWFALAAELNIGKDREELETVPAFAPVWLVHNDALMT